MMQLHFGTEFVSVPKHQRGVIDQAVADLQGRPIRHAVLDGPGDSVTLVYQGSAADERAARRVAIGHARGLNPAHWSAAGDRFDSPYLPRPDRP